MFTAIAFLAIVFIYWPIQIISMLISGNTKMTNDDIKKHNRQVRYEDKLDNDYGFIRK